MATISGVTLSKKFDAEVQQVLHDHATRALLAVLRGHLPTLTFGDLSELLRGAHGKSLAPIRVSALLSDSEPSAAEASPVASPAPAAAPQARAKKAGKKAEKKTTSKATRKAAKQAAKQAATERTREPTALDASILQVLQKGAPVTMGALRSTFNVSQTTAHRALRRLIEGGQVVMVGRKPRPAYMIAGAAAAVEASAPAPAPTSTKKTSKKAGKKSGAEKAAEKAAAKAAKKAARKAAKAAKASSMTPVAAAPEASAAVAAAPAPKASKGAKKAKVTKAAKAGRPSNRTDEGRKAYDIAILNILREQGDWTSISQIRPRIGGTDSQIRLGLARLVDGRMVERTGVRQDTRYKLVA